jgi:hypothetical protein
MILLLSIIVFSSTIAYASRNTLQKDYLGEGQGSVSGYTVSEIKYQLDSDPAWVRSVTLKLDSQAAQVKVRLTSTTVTWFDCVPQGDNTWICMTDGTSLSSIDIFRVLATGS